MPRALNTYLIFLPQSREGMVFPFKDKEIWSVTCPRPQAGQCLIWDLNGGLVKSQVDVLSTMTSKESQWPLSTQQFHSMPFSKETAMGWVWLHETYGAPRLTGFQNWTRLESSKWCTQAPWVCRCESWSSERLQRMWSNRECKGIPGEGYTLKKKEKQRSKRACCLLEL